MKRFLFLIPIFLLLASCTAGEKTGETTEDKLPTSVTVIDVAVSCRMQPAFTEAVKAFNAAHDDVRIMVHDYYSKHFQESTPDAPMERLALDISTGILQPDVVIERGFATENATSYIVKNNLYTDLTPLLDEDIFSCVRHTFTDDGKMWGITDSFYVNTFIINSATLDENYLVNEDIPTEEMAEFSENLREKGSWTVDEMLDYIESLPDDVMFTGFLTQTNSMHSNIYPSFIDTENGTCDFTGETFIRYLEFMKTLPKKVEVKSQFAYADSRSGKIAADRYDMHGIIGYSGMDVFFGGDSIPIGYPTRGEELAEMGYIYSYVITSYTETPDSAWEFVKSLLEAVGNENITAFPTLKSLYNEQCEYAKGCVFSHDITGTSGIYPLEDEHLIDLESYDTLKTYFTDDDAKELENFLDTKVGAAQNELIPGQVTDIIAEEISAYLADKSTAEACADRIQSRVSLWLAERN